MANKKMLDYEKAAAALRVVSHPQRLKILEILHAKALPVGAIQVSASLKQSVTSLHLNKMKNSGILSSKRKGNEVYYFVVNKEIFNIIACLKKCKGLARSK